MEIGLTIVGLLVVVLGPIATVAFRSDRKWPQFRNTVMRTAGYAILAFGFMGIGAAFTYVESTAKFAPVVISACAAIVGAAIVAFVLAWVADWLRDDGGQ